MKKLFNKLILILILLNGFNLAYAENINSLAFFSSNNLMQEFRNALGLENNEAKQATVTIPAINPTQLDASTTLFVNSTNTATSSTSTDLIVILATDTIATTSLSTSTNTSSTSNSSSSVASTTVTLTKKEITCDSKKKLITKKEKINKNIKSQIVDKSKLIDAVLEISSSTATESKDKVDNLILTLEEEVSNIVKLEKSLISTVSSSTEIACDTNSKSKKIIEKNNKTIKKLETEIDKKAEEINKIIKIDLKETLTQIRSN